MELIVTLVRKFVFHASMTSQFALNPPTYGFWTEGTTYSADPQPESRKQ